MLRRSSSQGNVSWDSYSGSGLLTPQSKGGFSSINESNNIDSDSDDEGNSNYTNGYGWVDSSASGSASVSASASVVSCSPHGGFLPPTNNGFGYSGYSDEHSSQIQSSITKDVTFIRHSSSSGGLSDNLIAASSPMKKEVTWTAGTSGGGGGGGDGGDGDGDGDVAMSGGGGGGGGNTENSYARPRSQSADLLLSLSMR